MTLSPAAFSGPPVPGPPLTVLLHTLAEAPADLADPATSLPALIADLVTELDSSCPPSSVLTLLDHGYGQAASPDNQRVAALTWLLARQPDVRTALVQLPPPHGGWLWAVLTALVRDLAGLRAPAEWTAEGREEFARAFLAVGAMLPAGETEDQAADAWLAVSTRHQRALLAAMAEERRRAEELAQKLAEQRAREAAAQYANY